MAFFVPRHRPHEIEAQAKAAFAAGDYRQAAEAYERLARTTTDKTYSVRALVCRRRAGEIALRHGEWNRAAEEFRAGLRIAPDYPDLQWRQAVALAKLGREQEAIRHLDNALARNQAFTFARITRAVIVYKRSHDPAMLDEIETCLERDHRLRPERLAAARRAHEEGRIFDAIANLEAVVPLGVPRVHLRTEIAEALSQQDRWEAAAREYRLAIDEEPSYADLRLALAHVLVHLRQIDDAEEQVRAALAINPRYEAARALLSEILAEREAPAIQPLPDSAPESARVA